MNQEPKQDEILRILTEKPEKKKRQKIRPGDWFYNNRFVMVFSIVISLALWLLMAYNDTQRNPVIVSNVPISVTLPETLQQKELKVYGIASDATAKVGVTGTPTIVYALNSTNMEVVPESLSEISGPGNYNLKLKVNKTSTYSNYDVKSISPSSISVTVDYAAEKTFEIKLPSVMDQINNDSYFSPGPTLSMENVTVSGPKSEIDKIDHVSFNYTPSPSPLEETKKTSANLILYDSDNKEIHSKFLSMSPSAVDISVQVMPKKTVTLVPTFKNKPAGISLSKDSYTVSPATIEVAAPKNVLSKLSDTLELAPVDFSQISTTQYAFNQGITLPTDCQNLSASSTAKVTLNNLANYTTKNLEVTNFTLTNIPTGTSAKILTEKLEVMAVGPEADLESMTDSNLIATVDLSGREGSIGTIPVQVSVAVSGSNRSWIYGNYTVNVVFSGTSFSGTAFSGTDSMD